MNLQLILLASATRTVSGRWYSFTDLGPPHQAEACLRRPASPSGTGRGLLRRPEPPEERVRVRRRIPGFH